MILQQFKRGIFLPVYDGQEASDVYPCPLETQQFSLYLESSNAQYAFGGKKEK